jgi:putative nucleotidyltransferase with HDIG domain
MDEGTVEVLIRALGPDAGLVLVGGAVRDRLLGRTGGDWDLATALLPEEVLRRAKAAKLRAIPTGLQHGTVTLLVDHRPIEITTYRGDGPYLDGRRPAHVTLGVALDEDLARRDFTVNAMALPLATVNQPDWRDHLLDPFGGGLDLEARVLRAVGDPLRRFAEDGLRPLRACRFASQLGFEVEPATLAAIPERLEVARKVSVERAFTELDKLLRGPHPARGLRLLEATGLLDLWLPELRPLVGCRQNRHHRLDVWEHTLLSLEAERTAAPELRWGLLLHDAGKPETRTSGPDDIHFYGHEAASARIAEAVLTRLRASNALKASAQGLILRHCEHPSADWNDAAYRRLLKRLTEAGVAPEAWALFRLADQYGKGWKACETLPDGRSGDQWWVEVEREWRGILARLEAVRFTGLTARELALDGHALLALSGRQAGPWMGQLQAHLLEAVLEEPGLNRAEALKPLAEAWLADHP